MQESDRYITRRLAIRKVAILGAGFTGLGFVGVIVGFNRDQSVTTARATFDPGKPIDKNNPKLEIKDEPDYLARGLQIGAPALAGAGMAALLAAEYMREINDETSDQV